MNMYCTIYAIILELSYLGYLRKTIANTLESRFLIFPSYRKNIFSRMKSVVDMYVNHLSNDNDVYRLGKAICDNHVINHAFI